MANIDTAGTSGPWEEIRDILGAAGFNIGTITLTGDNNLELRENAPRSLGYDISNSKDDQVSPFAQRVLGILQGAADVYHDRNAVYKDNFRIVGRVMEALFPEGRPPLSKASEYDRWHIFELIIVKLTRYANNFDNPHEDSLLDMLPYLGILGGLDQELREEIEKVRDAESAAVEERIVEQTGHPSGLLRGRDALRADRPRFEPGVRSSRLRDADGPNYAKADDDLDDLLDV